MSKSIWKPMINYLDPEYTYLHINKTADIIRRGTILKEHIGLRLPIHRGKEPICSFFIKKEMVGFKFGQLCFTKRLARPKQKEVRKKKKK